MVAPQAEVPPETKDGAKPLSCFTVGRRVLGMLVLVFLIAMAFVSVQGERNWLQVCSTQAAHVGAVATITVCRPPGLTDPLVLLSVLLFAMCFVPDLTKIGIPGLIEIERKVDRQAAQTDKLFAMVQQVSQSIELNISVGDSKPLPPTADLSELPASVAKKEREFGDV